MELSPAVRVVYTRVLPRTLRKRLERLISGHYPRIFDRKKFIFIHIPKTAGKSICELVGIKGARHLRYSEYEQFMGQRISDYFVFTVVRDPADRLFSAFSYMVRGGNQSTEDLAFTKDWITRYPTLNDFVLHALREPPVATLGKFRPQADFLVNNQEQWADNIHILRFETLARDIEILPRHIREDRSLPHVNRSVRDKARLQLSSEARNIISDFYRQDYERLGYIPPNNGDR